MREQPRARASELRLVMDGHEIARASTGLRAIVAGRAFIEGHVRRRMRALPNVRVVARCDAVGLTATADGTRITGVRLLPRAPGSAAETLPADLVVAATGRGARVPAWLTQLGRTAPAEERLAIDVRYASRYVRLPASALGGDKLVVVTARPDRPRALALFAQEGGRWLLTLAGYGPAHRPPTDPVGFAAYAGAVAPADVADALRAAEPLGDSPRTRSRRRCAGATSACATSGRACSSPATRSARSTRSTARA